MSITHHLAIQGHVQGVFFRESMCRKATQLGITGWVRNCRDGTVEAMIQGSPEAISLMTKWARIGPEQAHVTGVEVSVGSGQYSDFEKLHTV